MQLQGIAAVGTCVVCSSTTCLPSTQLHAQEYQDVDDHHCHERGHSVQDQNQKDRIMFYLEEIQNIIEIEIFR